MTTTEERFDWQDCLCFELGYQICHHYENWCDEQAEKEWWENLSQKERDDFMAVVTAPKPYVDDGVDF